MSYETVLSFLPGFAADILVKATLLLTVAALLDLSMRQCSAAMRHRVWATAFICLPLLPILSFAVPEYRLAILPAQWFVNESVIPRNAALLSTAQVEPPAKSAVFAKTAENMSLPYQDDLQIAVAQSPSSDTLPSELHSIAQSQVPLAPATVDVDKSPMALGWFQAIGMIGLVWCIGLFVTVSPLVLGVWRIMLLQRRSPSIVDQEPTNTLAELCLRLGILRRVRLLETEQSIVPMTWGLLSPVVLVPAAWRDWATERRRLVLLHELAHVKRLDVVYQSIARVACSLYWFHPLAWYALKRLRIERELACDDCVLMAGERPSQYAEQLLTIAREYQSLDLPPAVAMAQRSGLENRVRAMLDQARSHVPLTPKVAGGMLIVSVAMLLLVAPIRLGAISQPVVQADTVDVSEVAANKFDSKQMHISGIVTSPDNEPLAGVRVSVHRGFWTNGTREQQRQLLIEVKTDAEGRYQVDVPAKSDRFSDGFRFVEQRTLVHASKESYGPDEVEVEASNGSCNLQLAAAIKNIQGRFLDLEGKPIQGVKVKLVKIEKAGAPIATWMEQAKNNPATLNDPRMMMAQPVGATNWPRPVTFPSRGEITALDVHGVNEAVSDSTGAFTLPGIGDDRQATLRIESPTIATAWLHCVTHDMPSVNMPSMDPRFRVGRTFGAQFDFYAEPAQWIQGTVRDKQTGTPLSGIVVSLHQFGDSLLSIDNFIQSTTDANGRYVLKGIPKPPEGSNGVNLSVLPGQHQPYFRSEKRVPKSPGLGPIELDMALTRAIWLEGQVTDAKTKEPLTAMVAYFPSRDNRSAENHEKWNLNLATSGQEDMLPTDGNGRFRVPGLPGRGVLRVIAANDMEYELAEGVLPNVQRVPQKYYHSDCAGNAMVELEIAHDETLHRVDVAIKPLKMQSIHVVDANGNDVVGYQMAGILPTISGRGASYWSRRPMDTAFANVFPGEGPDRERPLMFIDAARKFGAVVPVKSVVVDNDVSYRVTLLPTVTIKGKLVDASGKALTRGYVKAGVGLTEFRAMFPTGNGANAYTTSSHPKYESLGHGAIDKEGTFEMAVPPGDGYSLVILGGDSNAVLFRDRELLPGQTIDLGAINVGIIDETAERNIWPAVKITQSRPESKTEVSKERIAAQTQLVNEKADEPYVFKGSVVHPDGTLAAGASLHLVYFEQGSVRVSDSSIPPVATTDSKGAFEIRGVPASKILEERIGLVATKQGFGLTNSKPLILFETTGKLVSTSKDGTVRRMLEVSGNDKSLRLVADDQSLAGRILTVDGIPVANASIRVSVIRSSKTGSLDQWEKATTDSKADSKSLKKAVEDGMYGFQSSSIVPASTTDSEGKFTLSGIGSERIVEIFIGGPGIETTKAF
ncbi:MAG TPA: M56 family metallopeptidase, partial [Pirellula sp.]|nr:M56 family metallopeptidase [Pirellula sp.]